MNDLRISSELIARAQAMIPSLRVRSSEIDQLRRLPSDIATDLAKAGFYRLFIEQRHGGLEVSPSTAATIFETLAQGDSAAGWVAFIGATTGTLLARIPDEAIKGILASPETLITGVVAPHGRAEMVSGGFIVNGRWPWGSGSDNAHWIAGGCQLTRNGEVQRNSANMPRTHLLLFPKKDVRSLDTWHVSGLRGTGSTDFEVKDLFVPETHASGFLVRGMPNRPLFQFPQNPLLASGIGAVALGIGRAAIDEFVALANVKKRAGSNSPLASRSHTHLEVATAEARLRSARAYFFASIDDAWATAVAQQEVTVAQRREMRLANSFAVQTATQVVDAMFTLAGGSAIYESSRMQRHLRDIHVATQHIMVGPQTFETAGRIYLGVDADISNF